MKNPSFSHYGVNFSITMKTMGMSHVTQSDPITMWHAPTDDRCLFNEE
jgi:hypothetical protein